MNDRELRKEIVVALLRSGLDPQFVEMRAESLERFIYYGSAAKQSVGTSTGGAISGGIAGIVGRNQSLSNAQASDHVDRTRP